MGMIPNSFNSNPTSIIGKQIIQTSFWIEVPQNQAEMWSSGKC